MSTSRKEEIIRKGFLKSLVDGTLELKDLAGINIDLELARYAYLQGVQETTQELIELMQADMATAAGQALQATAAKQDLAKTVLDSIDVKVGKLFVIIPSDDLLISNDDTEEWSVGGSGSTMKMKEYFIQVSGLFRVKFDCMRSGGVWAKAQIYKNGVEYGTEWDMTEAWVTRSQDLPFIAGDLCQLYIIDGDASYQYVRNHRLYGAWSTGIAMETT